MSSELFKATLHGRHTYVSFDSLIINSGDMEVSEAALLSYKFEGAKLFNFSHRHP